ncbi:MAG TPA: terminase [Acidobacteriaceae bacterium]|nr:terminase [Acidobacteriaceae bacterium]
MILTTKVLTIRNKLGQQVALIPNKAQAQFASRAQNAKRNIVLKARQMGVSTWIAGQYFLKMITHPGTVAVQVAHTQDAAEQIFRIVHRFLANLPEELRGGALKNARANRRRILIPELDSEYLVETAGDRNAGRGMTITHLHCTELARWPGDAAETLCGLIATLSPAGTLAMESTPMGASGCFWREWQDAERTGTVQHFFPWWLEDAYTGEPAAEESLTEAERMLMDTQGLSREQIGYRRQIQEKFRGLAKQEYAEDADDCFFASGSCYFDTEAIDRRLKQLGEPAWTRRRGSLQIWLPPLPGRKYLLAVDPAGGGTAGDFTAMQVIDLETAMQCAELQDHLGPREAAHDAALLAQEYNHALVAVERNNMGMTVLTCLEDGEAYDNLYVHEDKVNGFLTTSSSRSQMLSNLYSLLVEEPKKLMSERLLRECRSFVRLENGRLEARGGEHDDLVLAMAIAVEARKLHLERRPVR